MGYADFDSLCIISTPRLRVKTDKDCGLRYVFHFFFALDTDMVQVTPVRDLQTTRALAILHVLRSDRRLGFWVNCLIGSDVPG